MSHTPGPWEVTDGRQPPRPYVVLQTSETGIRGTQVAAGKPTGATGWPVIGVAGISIEEARANARLAAAAPALVKCCHTHYALFAMIAAGIQSSGQVNWTELRDEAARILLQAGVDPAGRIAKTENTPTP